MPSLLLKNIDASLLREINYAAAKAELTQRDWAISVLCKEVGIAAAKVQPSENNHGGVGAAAGDRDTEVPSLPIVATPEKTPKAVGKPRTPECPRCRESKGVVEWGPMWHCNPCGSNFAR